MRKVEHSFAENTSGYFCLPTHFHKQKFRYKIYFYQCYKNAESLKKHFELGKKIRIVPRVSDELMILGLNEFFLLS